MNDRTVWDDLLPDASGWGLEPFQVKAIGYGIATVAILLAWIFLGLEFQFVAPIGGFAAIEAVKNIRHWIEWRLENPRVRLSSPDQVRRLERETVRVMSDSVRSRAWFTWTAIVCCAVPSTIQMVVGLEHSVQVASVDPRPILEGEWWRLLSGTYLHGSVYHFMGNMTALLMYGAILESKTSRLRLPLVYVLSCLGGSVASVLMPLHDIPSIGASGGVVGVIAYLYVFSRRQAVKFPAAFRGATATVFVGLVTMGALGYWYIDNPGHAGGALMGFMLAGLMVDTAQNFIGEPELPLLDLLGWIATGVLVAGAVTTSMALLTL